MSYPHVCIKPGCGNKYSDNDPDAYYCPPCKEVNVALAKEIDAKGIGKSSERPPTDLQIAETMGKTINSSSPHGGKSTFVRASDLGI